MRIRIQITTGPASLVRALLDGNRNPSHLGLRKRGRSDARARPRSLIHSLAPSLSSPIVTLVVEEGKKKRDMGKKKGKGGGQQSSGVVTEATRVRIGKVLEEFRTSEAEVYTFESGLSKQERAAIHEMCRKMGMISKSSGYGERRCLSVYKSKKKNGSIKKEEEMITCLQFSEEVKEVLQDLFLRYPPDDVQKREDAVNYSSVKVGKGQWKQDSSFCKPAMRKSDIAKKVEQLASRINNSSQLRKIVEDRAKLPIASFKDSITSTLETNQVVLISGETGCGKTTQVPQYLLDYMWDKGEACKIICTQPRRISAISVAERISYERGETVGETVGYKIRLESKGGKQSSIMFCTNGVLLRLLISRGSNLSGAEAGRRQMEDCFQGLTHVIVDEIHERDRFSDFMLAIIRDLLPSYPHMRLVLMSATIDAERFSNYFNGCPIIQVPGFTYPVKIFYLEDVLTILKSVDGNHLNHVAVGDSQESSPLTEEYKNDLDEAINLALANDEFDPLLELISTEQTPGIYNYKHSLAGISPLMVFAGKGRVGDVCMLLSFGADCSLCDNDGGSALDWAQRGNQPQVKLLDPSCRVADFLHKTLDPPVPETVHNALIVLQDIGALTHDERLTELGEKLGSLPVHPSTSKMLLFAILMNCLDPALTLACAADYREPFILPMAPDGRKKAAIAKLELASLYGGYSDQLAVVAAFDCWRKAKERGQESQFCSRYFVSSSTMNMLCSMRKQLQNELAKNGFIPADMSSCSLNAHDPGILRAVLMAGSYPMVGRLLPRRKNDKRAIVETPSGAKVRLHPHSSNFNLSFGKAAGCPLIIYDEITRGDGGMYIKNCSLIGPYPLLLLAMEMVVAPGNENDDESDDDLDGSSLEEDEMETTILPGQCGEEIMSSPDNNVSVVVDRWLRFESTALDVAQIYCLRERLSASILFKVKYPQAVLPPALGTSMYAIACILSYDGLPSVLADAVLEPQPSGRDGADPGRPFQGGRLMGFIPPGAFLRSLISDKVQGSHSRKDRRANLIGPVSAHSISHSPVRSPVPGPGSGSSAPRIRSFKRRR
ncbi:R3H domain [Musa troglodytarum]|uniref:R3H domain n=1 Tax=Musa troglodytarum TaxID=320322 RepID=A0A9E7K5N3_9LILI|nr:R3H domain [Musa troglodytarum]